MPRELSIQRSTSDSETSWKPASRQSARTGRAWAALRAAGVPSVLVTFGPLGAGVADLSPEALLHRYEDMPALARQLLD